jgi:hypothetical protein
MSGSNVRLDHIPTLEGVENFHLWARSMKTTLLGEDRWKFISNMKDPLDEEELGVWKPSISDTSDMAQLQARRDFIMGTTEPMPSFAGNFPLSSLKACPMIWRWTLVGRGITYAAHTIAWIWTHGTPSELTLTPSASKTHKMSSDSLQSSTVASRNSLPWGRN